MWLAPEQARIVTVSDRFNEYARQVETALREAGFRVSGDYRPEKIGAKIRDGSLEKIPYLLIIGEKEQESGRLSAKVLKSGEVKLIV